jgi:hypothetical protein
MVVIEGDAVEQVVLRGPGAGEGPTASAVMGDVCDIARGITIPVFGQPAASLDPAPPANAESPACFFFCRKTGGKTAVFPHAKRAFCGSPGGPCAPRPRC